MAFYIREMMLPKKTPAKRVAILTRFGVAVALVAAALVVRLAGMRWLGTSAPYVTFYPAVVLAALYGGRWSGLLAAGLAMVAADYFLLDPIGHWFIVKSSDRGTLFLFLGTCVVISWVTESLRRARLRATVAEDEAKVAAERESVMHALRNSDARFIAFAKAAFEGVVELELEHIVDCNEQFSLMLGRRIEEVRGKAFTEFVAVDDRQRVREGILRGTESAMEYILLRPDGSQVVVEARGRPVSTDHGRRIKVVRDITTRQQGEEALRRLNRTLRVLSRSGQVMLLATDQREYMNQVCRGIRDCGHAMVWIGLAENDPAKTVRPVAWAGFDESYLATLDITWSDTERGQGPTGTAIRLGRPSVCQDMTCDPNFGPWRAEALKRGYASSLVLPLLNGGKAFGAVTIYSNQVAGFPHEEVQLLTELAADLAQGILTLRHGETSRLQSTALQSAANAIVITQVDGAIQWVNSAFTALTGYTSAESMGQNPRVLKSGKHPPEFYTSLWQTIMAGQVWHGELINKRKDGTFYTEEMTITPVRAGNRSITHFVAIKQDVTGRKEMEISLAKAKEALERQNQELEQRVVQRTASLRQAVQEMERFAYVASHDLQEPLRTVSSFSQLLARRYEGKLDSDADEFIEFIVDGAARMQRLINDLLELSRIGTRGKPFAPVDCGEVIQIVRKNLEMALAESGTVVTQEPLPTVTGDRTQLIQLFQNLLSNAIKFRQKGNPARIEVGASSEKGGWHFLVRDNGIGIDPQFFERIFIVFQRLHDREEYPGTGIGLAICKKIVERHGGRLWVESSPGKGSTFHFTIPAKE